MTTPLAPSTEWREDIAADEEQRFAEYAERVVRLQSERSKRYGPGRGLHRLAHLGLQATLEVKDQLPEAARFGLFAQPASYEVHVRISNGAADRKPGREPDIRGFSLRTLGVNGTSALGDFPAVSQDFLLINSPVFAFPKSDEFADMLPHAVAGKWPLIKYFIGRYGFLGGLKRVGKLVKSLKRPFSGFATETFHSAAPMACGPYAVKVRLVPVNNGAPNPGAADDWAKDVTDRLRTGPLQFDLQLQFFVNESITPIEDASVLWPEEKSPFVTVAQLHIPQQDAQSAEGKALAEKIEAEPFDPWAGLREHRPLGDVMRARKVVYFASQKNRGLH